MVDYPSLKKLELSLGLQRIGVHMSSSELLKGSCNIEGRRGKRREEDKCPVVYDS